MNTKEEDLKKYLDLYNKRLQPLFESQRLGKSISASERPTAQSMIDELKASLSSSNFGNY